jgi:hypothetical protein
VIGGAYDWDDVKQHFLDEIESEMRSKGCLVSAASGPESTFDFSNPIVQRYACAPAAKGA